MNIINYIANIYNFSKKLIFNIKINLQTTIINEKNDLNIWRQSVYLYEREACRINLVKKRARIMENNKKTRNNSKWDISL